jgi:hypothetical protein
LKKAIVKSLPAPLQSVPDATLLQEPAPAIAGRDLDLLWFALSKFRLTSLALIPADASVSLERVSEVTRALADVGQRLVDLPVTAIVLDAMDRELLTRVGAVLGAAREGSTAWANNSPLAVIVAVPSVLTEPVGLALAQAADGVVLCAAMGETRIDEARRTRELIGADRVVGCIVV